MKFLHLEIVQSFNQGYIDIFSFFPPTGGAIPLLPPLAPSRITTSSTWRASGARSRCCQCGETKSSPKKTFGTFSLATSAAKRTGPFQGVTHRCTGRGLLGEKRKSPFQDQISWCQLQKDQVHFRLSSIHVYESALGQKELVNFRVRSIDEQEGAPRVQKNKSILARGVCWCPLP